MYCKNAKSYSEGLFIFLVQEDLNYFSPQTSNILIQATYQAILARLSHTLVLTLVVKSYFSAIGAFSGLIIGAFSGLKTWSDHFGPGVTILTYFTCRFFQTAKPMSRG